MGRINNRKEILHQPSTHEIFFCLSSMVCYSKILLGERQSKPYGEFLNSLVQTNFYNANEEKITIKRLAADFKSDSTKVTKWIREIYDDIFELNYDKPDLFQKAGIRVALYLKHFDNSGFFYTSMPVIPREFEVFNFPFVKSKLGIDVFWVKKVEYEMIEDITSITIWLEGGFVNKYREYALAKALFQERIHFMEVYNKHPYEIDEELKKIYRN